MLTCCCSLAGTKACLSCNNYQNAFGSINYSPFTITKTIFIDPAEDKPKKVVPVKQYWCDNCDALLTIYQKYCHNCGKEIDWTNEEE